MNLINITINTIHTITSPNNTIPVAPNTDTLTTTNAISNNKQILDKQITSLEEEYNMLLELTKRN